MIIKNNRENFIVAIILVVFVSWILSVITFPYLFMVYILMGGIYITTIIKQVNFSDKEILIEKYVGFWDKVISYDEIQRISIKQEGYMQYKAKIVKVFYVRNNRNRVFKMKTNSEDELLELKKFFKKKLNRVYE